LTNIYRTDHTPAIVSMRTTSTVCCMPPWIMTL